MKKLTFVLIGGTALAIAATAGVAGYLGRPAIEGSSWFGARTKGATDAAATEVVPVAITALGRLEPETEIIGVGLPAGSRVDRLGDKVVEGALVNRGQPLAYLDSYAELLAARDLAAVQLEEAKERLKAETAFGRAGIESAKLKIRQAEEVLPRAIAAQEAEVRRSEAELAKSKLDLDRSQRILNDGAIPQSQHDAVALLHQQCHEKQMANQATLEHLKSDREIRLLSGRAELESAQAGLVRAELTTLVASLTGALKLANARLERSVIKAPIDGEIIKVFTRAGESSGQQPLLKMGDTRTMYAVAEVYETDVRFVRPGQKATVTSRAFPGESVTGEVDRVGSLVHKNDVLGLDPAKDADTRVVEVRIRLNDSRLTSKYNQMQVDVSIRRDP